jgi:hypothetical protein
MNSATDFLDFLKNFNNLSTKEQGDVAIALDQIVDTVANGVWDNNGEHRQCHFCCRGPHSEHLEFCAVEVARKFREKHLDFLNRC